MLAFRPAWKHTNQWLWILLVVKNASTRKILIWIKMVFYSRQDNLPERSARIKRIWHWKMYITRDVRLFWWQRSILCIDIFIYRFIYRRWVILKKLYRREFNRILSVEKIGKSFVKSRHKTFKVAFWWNLVISL